MPILTDNEKKAYDDHIIAIQNPHGTTPTDIGLDRVDNTSDLDKPVSIATNTALDLKPNKTDIYDKTDFIDSSIGSSDANKPIKTNGQGKLGMSFLEFDGFFPQGDFTPTAGDEYPDVSGGEPFGSLWIISGVDVNAGYEYVTGNLAGRTAYNGFMLIYGETNWALVGGSAGDSVYYRIDGTTALEADFVGGGFKITNISYGTENSDGVSLGQLNGGLALKENLLDNPSANGMVLSSLTDGTRSWIEVGAGSGDGDMLKSVYDPTNQESDVFDMDNMFEGSSNLLVGQSEKTFWNAKQDPTTTLGGYGITDAYTKTEVNNLNSTQDTAIALNTAKVTGADRVLQTAYDTKQGTQDTAIALNTAKVTGADRLLSDLSEFIDSSTGVGEANRAIKTNASGKVSMSLLEIDGFYPQGGWTPEAGTEYPDTTGLDYGSFFVIEGLASSYTFTGGDLVGREADNGSLMFWMVGGWALVEAQIDPSLYYRIDGTTPITGDFAGGGNKITNILDGTVATDGVTKGQLDTKADTTTTDEMDTRIVGNTSSISSLGTRVTDNEDDIATQAIAISSKVNNNAGFTAITAMTSLTQAEYDVIAEPNASTLYVIVG